VTNKNFQSKPSISADDNKEVPTYNFRLRFKVRGRIALNSRDHTFEVSRHPVTLAAPRGQLISDSDWLTMTARRFATPDDANNFAEALKKALEVTSAMIRFGVDSGTDIAHSGMSAWLREEIRQNTGMTYRNDVHGIAVLPDDENTRFVSASASASQLWSHEILLSSIADLHGVSGEQFSRTHDMVLLLNYALMRDDPVSQIVFAISAVEMLGQNEAWSDNQKKLLETLALHTETFNEIGTEDERSEVADAVRKSVHKLSLRQGVLRLLNSLGLSHLKKEWDTVYGLRSELVHGLAPQPGADYRALAGRTMDLCGAILMAAIARHIPMAASKAAIYYPVLNRTADALASGAPGIRPGN
jgi:hypothetical protein